MRPIAVEEIYVPIDETGTWNHQSEICIRDAFWLGSVRGIRATIVTFFDADEQYTWKVLIELDPRDRHTYDISAPDALNTDPKAHILLQ